jgi:AraC family transcriptional regulator, regulatory protein of adaptative response / methylated-DNA-[protein]-cysteine methyltransferase
MTATIPETTDDAWEAIRKRDAQLDGAFVYVAVTTGIYCRPSCPARHPRRRNVLVLPTASDAELQGYMACRRCHPRADELTPAETAVKAALEYIAAHFDQLISLKTLSQVTGLSANHLQETFKRIVGLSPKALVDAHRVIRLKQYLRLGASISSASYDVGFGSSRALYEKATKNLGMTPARYARGGDGARIAYASVGTPLGRVLVAGTDRGVCSILVGSDEASLVRELRTELPKAFFVRDEGAENWLEAVRSSLREYPLVSKLPDDVRRDVFRAKIWNTLR